MLTPYQTFREAVSQQYQKKLTVLKTHMFREYHLSLVHPINPKTYWGNPELLPRLIQQLHWPMVQTISEKIMQDLQ